MSLSLHDMGSGSMMIYSYFDAGTSPARENALGGGGCEKVHWRRVLAAFDPGVRLCSWTPHGNRGDFGTRLNFSATSLLLCRVALRQPHCQFALKSSIDYTALKGLY